MLAVGGGGRVYLNPIQLPVTWGSAQILHAHLLNARHAAEEVLEEEESEAIVVIHYSNARWFRPCVERYVTALLRWCRTPQRDAHTFNFHKYNFTA